MPLNGSYKSWHRPDQSDNARTKQGYARIKNTNKYIGDPSQIIYRSSWEFAFIKFCDMSPDVIRWSSEPIGIKYYDKVSNIEKCQKLGLDPNNPVNWAVRNYYTDFWCEVYKDGIVQKMFIEIKPSNKLIKPKAPAPNASPQTNKRFNRIAKEYLINEEKFKAINEYAIRNGAVFKVFTEKTLRNLIG